MIEARAALARLRTGNQRFVEGTDAQHRQTSAERRDTLMGGQDPLAIVLGCSDSRVPAEFVFDQGLGDLFVIRVAGNVVAPSQIGSIEFAAERFGTRLVVVLGHTQCGAVEATLEELERPSEHRSPNLSSIVDRIRPSVEELLAAHDGGDRADLIHQAVRSNIHHSAAHVRSGSQILKRLIQDDGLLVVEAEYSLESGFVEFFDEAHATAGSDGNPLD